jgi:hypothetical protein
VQEGIRATLQVEQQCFEVKYLGLPTPDGRMNKGKFMNLQSRLSKLLMEWGDTLLDQCSRGFDQSNSSSHPDICHGGFQTLGVSLGGPHEVGA